MIAPTQSAPLYRDPGTLARLFVYAFAFSTPLLTIGAGLLPAAIVASSGADGDAWAIATVATLAYVAALAVAVRRVRILSARFTPPLPLPGDIWNIGVAQPPRRSRNWPIRFRRRPRPPGGVPKPDLRAAA